MTFKLFNFSLSIFVSLSLFSLSWSVSLKAKISEKNFRLFSLQAKMSGAPYMWYQVVGLCTFRLEGSWVETWAAICLHCQRGKVHKQPLAPLHAIQVPECRFSHLHLDIHLYPPLQKVMRACWPSLTDPHVGWRLFPWSPWRPECSWTPSSPTGWHVLGCMVLSWVTAAPSSCHHCGLACAQGRGSSKSSPLLPRAMRWWRGYTGRSRMPYGARSGGLTWPSHLPWVLLILGLRVAPKEDSGTSSAELVLGSSLLLPGELLHVPEVPLVHLPPLTPTKPASYAVFQLPCVQVICGSL